MGAVAIVLNYNYGRYLEECLDSIAAQTYPDIRTIVVDDASKDSSRDVIESWIDRSGMMVEAIFKTENRGPAHSYNLAIQSLTDEDSYVAIIDADDTLLPDKFSSQVAAFQLEEPGCAVIYSDVQTLDGATGEVSIQPSQQLIEGETPIGRLLSRGTFFALNSAMIRADALRSIPPLDEGMRICDYPMWLALSRVGSFRYVPLLAGTVRVHGSSMLRTEVLTEDRLRLLGRNAKSRVDRSDARVRGRHLLNTAAISASPPTLGAYVEYGLGARDWRAVPAALLSFTPGASSVVRRVWGSRPHHRDLA